jgi:hypothetical protein
MSIGTPEPALLHSNFDGQRAGTFFVFRDGSTGSPGATFGIPASNEAQGRTQKALPIGFPFASLCWMQRCDRCVQSAFFLQLLPSPAVRGSRGSFFVVRGSGNPVRRSAASRRCIRSASA